MIVLFTDFGAGDLYVGQLKAVLGEHAAGTPVVDLLHQAPRFNPRAAAHLLAALAGRFPAGAVFLAVVDPGVGTTRDAVILRADERWYVGPDNGLLSVVAARAGKTQSWRIVWRPPALSASFHGRDLFAPMAAWIASGRLPADKTEPIAALAVRLGADDLPEAIYVDHYGNVLTGLRAGAVKRSARIDVRGQRLPCAGVFAEAPEGRPFWYENSIGLVELAANRASAAELLDIGVGDPVSIIAA
jgi:S-adenosyl-L-methionine hydrolase (adenosine-forming)